MNPAKHLKLTEADIDAANADKFGPTTAREDWSEVMQDTCDHRCRQGRYHECQMPEEFPPLNWKTALIGAICFVAVIGYCVLTQGS